MILDRPRLHVAQLRGWLLLQGQSQPLCQILPCNKLLPSTASGLQERRLGTCLDLQENLPEQQNMRGELS